MAYLRTQDYYIKIDQRELAALEARTVAVAPIRNVFELIVQEQITSQLVQKYDVAREFRDTTIWNSTKAYKADDLFYLDATAYSSTSTYTVNALVSFNGNIYKNTTAVTTPEAFDQSKWTLVGMQFAMYYAVLPNPEFNWNTEYDSGTTVFWKDKVYTSQRSTRNVFPDDPKYGLSYWGTGTAYSVVAGTLPSDAKFVAGDNRSQKIVEIMVDMVLYKMHAKIPLTNVPQNRYDNYQEALAWLEQCKLGNGTANIPLLQPKQGFRIRSGGVPKNNNHY